MIDIRDPAYPKHLTQTSFLRKLLTDIKLQLQNEEPLEPITAERIEQARRHLDLIEDCTERQPFRY